MRVTNTSVSNSPHSLGGAGAGAAAEVWRFNPVNFVTIASDHVMFDGHARAGATQRIARVGDGSSLIAAVPSGEPALGYGGRYDTGTWHNVRTDTGGRYVDPSDVRPVQNWLPDALKNPVDWTPTNGGVGVLPVVTDAYATGPGGTPGGATRVQLSMPVGQLATDFSRLYITLGLGAGKRKVSLWLASNDATIPVINIQSGDDPAAVTLVELNASWQRFRGMYDGATPYGIGLSLVGDGQTAWAADILVGVEADYYPQIEEDETAGDGIPGESVAPGGCAFFSWTNGNSVSSP